MLDIALGLVHNKTNLANRQQIQNLLALLTLHGSDTDPETLEPTGLFWYEVNGLALEHRVRCFQIVPFGVSRPNNLDSLDSHKVVYRAGDEDKTGEHPRFFNWLLKRSTDFGGEVALYIRFPTLFGIVDLETRLNLLLGDPGLVLLEPTWGKVGTLRLLREVGQLSEDRSFDLAVTALKTRIAARGLRSG